MCAVCELSLCDSVLNSWVNFTRSEALGWKSWLNCSLTPTCLQELFHRFGHENGRSLSWIMRARVWSLEQPADVNRLSSLCYRIIWPRSRPRELCAHTTTPPLSRCLYTVHSHLALHVLLCAFVQRIHASYRPNNRLCSCSTNCSFSMCFFCWCFFLWEQFSDCIPVQSHMSGIRLISDDGVI